MYPETEVSSTAKVFRALCILRQYKHIWIRVVETLRRTCIRHKLTTIGLYGKENLATYRSKEVDFHTKSTWKLWGISTGAPTLLRNSIAISSP